MNQLDDKDLFEEFEKDFESLNQFEKWFTTMFNVLLYFQGNYIPQEDQEIVEGMVSSWSSERIPTAAMSIDLMRRNLGRNKDFVMVLTKIGASFNKGNQAYDAAKNLMRELGINDVDGPCRRRRNNQE
jgi:hypothetical protein